VNGTFHHSIFNNYNDKLLQEKPRTKEMIEALYCFFNLKLKATHLPADPIQREQASKERTSTVC